MIPRSKTYYFDSVSLPVSDLVIPLASALDIFFPDSPPADTTHDQKMQFACVTRQNLCDYLAANMDNNLLMNGDYNNAYIDGEQNVKSAKLISLRDVSGFGNPKGAVEYAATIDFKFRNFKQREVNRIYYSEKGIG